MCRKTAGGTPGSSTTAVSGKLPETEVAGHATREAMFRDFGNTARQEPRCPTRGRNPLAYSGLTLWLACTALLPAIAGSHPTRGNEPPEAKPEERIAVSTLGYRPPGSLYLLSGMSFSSLNFIDSQRLLFTFHEFQLLHRTNDASSSDDDEMIHALVLDAQDGRVSATAQWRMHDRGRYLWPLTDGRFLVRQRDIYSITDGSLQLHTFLKSPTRVRVTELSPDGRLLAVEREVERHTPEDHVKAVEQAASFGDDSPAEDTEIDLVSMDTLTVEQRIRVELPIVLPVTSSGYIGVEEGKKSDEYILQFFPFHGQEITLGSVASACRPREMFLNATALMIESCGPNTPDTFIDTWTAGGKKLWQGRRDGRSVSPTLAASRNGNRFAIGLLQITHPVNLADSLTDSDVKAQVVQVFDTNTGALLLTTYASPILMSGQNFALSPDGDRLAVLRDGAINIYKVPAAAPTPAQK
jgi:hypothetical protein